MPHKKNKKIVPKARLIAFYLPQFHPIPENDEWWGKGFTEWTNVANATPLFRGHYQPHIPADLGFYDLRVPETRVAQANMAREYGIEGFCYWHYWFASRRIIDRPFNEVLRSGEPDFPFCLGWANDSWTGIWHGCADKMLIEQTYPGAKDEEAHFHALLEAFSDKRYITVDGKPLFLIYKPYKLPEPNRFLNHWRELAVKNGLKGIYFVGNARTMEWVPEKDGFDAMVPHNPGLTFYRHFNPHFDDKKKKFDRHFFKDLYREKLSIPEVIKYEEYIKYATPELRDYFDEYPCVLPNWDNTPRCGSRGNVLTDSTPELFRIHLRDAIRQVSHRERDKRIVFVKSWNEWAEGNYLEPDQRFGRAYLEVCREEVTHTVVAAKSSVAGKIDNSAASSPAKAVKMDATWDWRIFEKEARSIDIDGLKAQASPTEFNVDRLNDSHQHSHKLITTIPAHASYIEIVGWAIDSPNKSVAGGVCVEINGRRFVAHYGLKRPDVAKVKGSQYLHSGFRVLIPSSEIGKGKHTLTAKVISRDLNSYYSNLERTLSFTIE
jgi:hypothetical protein